MKSKISILCFFIILSVIISVNPASSQTAPVVDIKANTSDGPITISTNDSLSITISASGGSGDADWWYAAFTPFGLYYFSEQSPLYDISSKELINMSNLPVGTYNIYFGVDMNVNGQLDFDQLHFDEVVVNVTEAATASLVGTWEATDSDSYISLILTETDIIGKTNYTWVNECAESGMYWVSGSSITFMAFFTNCDEEHGLAGGASEASEVSISQHGQKTYEWSVEYTNLLIKNYREGRDLILNMIRPNEHFQKEVGEGRIEVTRKREIPSQECCSRPQYREEITGVINFKIYYYVDAKGVRYYVHGEEEFSGGIRQTLCSCYTWGSVGDMCTMLMSANGKVRVSGWIVDSGEFCSMVILVNDNYFWEKCRIIGYEVHYQYAFEACKESFPVGEYATCIEPRPVYLGFEAVGQTENFSGLWGNGDFYDEYKLVYSNISTDFINCDFPFASAE